MFSEALFLFVPLVASFVVTGIVGIVFGRRMSHYHPGISLVVGILAAVIVLLFTEESDILIQEIVGYGIVGFFFGLIGWSIYCLLFPVD